MLALDSPITWRSAAIVGLGFAGEYALLALIEDAPEALKVATMVCAVVVIVILLTEKWFHQKHRYLFVISILLVAAIYVGFVIYAAVHAITRQERQAHLREIYVSGNLFKNRELPLQQEITTMMRKL
jgi:Mn2+/Fe2+ NRAMP family transporter